MARCRCLGLLVCLVAGPWSGAVAAPVRTILQQSALPAGPAQTAMLGTVSLKAGEGIPWHTHSGVEMGYVSAGQVTLSLAGEPDRTVAAGASFTVPRGVAHSVHAAGDGALLVISWMIDAGAPLSTPASPPAR
jgi:quercetin dioxygenase-like cupin family protein